MPGRCKWNLKTIIEALSFASCYLLLNLFFGDQKIEIVFGDPDLVTAYVDKKRYESVTGIITCDDLYKEEILDKNDTYFAVKLDNNLSLDSLRIFINTTRIENGCYRPATCIPTQEIAIIVPYRDRQIHLNNLLFNLHHFLQRQHRSYCIFISEQYDKGKFNRAKLLNVGYLEAMKTGHFDCLIFRDVDLYPEDLRNLYSCFEKKAIHMCDTIDKYDYVQQFSAGKKFTAGGVLSISKFQYELVNGHPNSIFGWGGEDHLMGDRIRKSPFVLSNIVTSEKMERYLLGTTNTSVINETIIVSGGPGYVRQVYGQYKMFPHMYGFNSGKGKKQLDIYKGNRTGFGQEIFIEEKRVFDGLKRGWYRNTDL